MISMRRFFGIAAVTVGLLLASPALGHDALKDLRLRQEDHVLSASEYKEIRNELEKAVMDRDPGKAIGILATKMATYKSIYRSCHSFVHEIGHAAYRKYGSFEKAMEYQDDLCGSGYLHGIIELYFTTVKDVKKEMQTLCAGKGGKCYHGVGHGLMFLMDNDVPASLSLCDTYKDAAARTQCGEGVFMENFNTDEENHHSEYLREDDMLYPCPAQASRYKGACYFYAPRYMLQLHPNSYDVAFSTCTTAEKSGRFACFKGVGSAAMKQRLNQVSYVESICMTAPSEGIGACLQGMGSYYSVNFASSRQAAAMCRKLKKQNQAACLSGI